MLCRSPVRRIPALAMATAICAPLGACGSSHLSPRAVRASIIATALAQKSVHFEEDNDVTMGAGVTITADVTADSGMARLDSDEGTEEVRLVHDTVYVREFPSGLVYDFGLSRTRARSLARRWISVPRGDTKDTYIALWYLTLPAVLNLTSGMSLGTMPNRLPADFAGVTHDDGDTISTDGSFTRWNEPVQVRAPANALPLSTIRRR